MKFSTSAALFALSAATMVAAAPVAKRADSNAIKTVDLNDPSLFAAFLDPTFEDAPFDDTPMSALDAPAAVATPQVMSTMGVGVPKPFIRPQASSKLNSQVLAASASRPVALPYVAAKPTQAVANAPKVVTSSRVQSAAPAVVTAYKYTTGPNVISTIPGRTSTTTKISSIYTIPPASSKFITSTLKVSSTKLATSTTVIKNTNTVVSYKTSTSVVKNTNTVTATLPGKTSTTTKINYNPAAVPITSTVIVPAGSSTRVIYVPGHTSTTRIIRYYNPWTVKSTPTPTPTRA